LENVIYLLRQGKMVKVGEPLCPSGLRFILQSRNCGRNGDTYGDRSELRTLAKCEAQFPELERISKLREAQKRTVSYFLNDYYRVIEN
jgi:hypothetical protein